MLGPQTFGLWVGWVGTHPPSISKWPNRHPSESLHQNFTSLTHPLVTWNGTLKSKNEKRSLKFSTAKWVNFPRKSFFVKQISVCVAFFYNFFTIFVTIFLIWEGQDMPDHTHMNGVNQIDLYAQPQNCWVLVLIKQSETLYRSDNNYFNEDIVTRSGEFYLSFEGDSYRFRNVRPDLFISISARDFSYPHFTLNLLKLFNY